jgi:hypothetical protein
MLNKKITKKNIPKKEQLKKDIESLESVLESSNIKFENDQPKINIDKEKDKVHYLDIEKIKADALAASTDYVDYLVDFYLAGAILDEPFLKKKKDDDTQTLADLIFQMKTSEYAIIKLLEVIDEGGQIIPRNFEVLAGLQKSKMEIVKHYEAVKMNIESNYRNMASAFIQKQENNIPLIEAAGYGQKKLIEKIRNNSKINEFGNIEEAEYTVEEHKLPEGVKFYK